MSKNKDWNTNDISLKFSIFCPDRSVKQTSVREALELPRLVVDSVEVSATQSSFAIGLSYLDGRSIPWSQSVCDERLYHPSISVEDSQLGLCYDSSYPFFGLSTRTQGWQRSLSHQVIVKTIANVSCWRAWTPSLHSGDPQTHTRGTIEVPLELNGERSLFVLVNCSIVPCARLAYTTRWVTTHVYPLVPRRPRVLA